MHKSFLYVRRPKNGKLVSEGRFPEYNIRHVATIFLQSVTSSLEGASGSRQRLTAALTHSGNQKLRSNIMLGLLFIGGRSANVGRCVAIPALIFLNVISVTDYFLRKMAPIMLG